MQDHAHQWDEQQKINEGLQELAKRTGAKLVVTADCHYSKHEDREAHEILLCVQTGKTLGDANRMTMDMDLYVSDPVDIAKRWEHLPEVMTNTVAIAERCDVTLEMGGILIPKFPVPTEQTEREYLHELVYQGLAWRYGNIPKEDIAHITAEKAKALVEPSIVERLEFELGVIAKMGYDGYFLIVADFINWGKNEGIIFGPGRGSAAGSIVAYALNITDIDPIHYDLLFERFLNPDRISMPDIDVDMQDTRRQEVIDYVVEKYGSERVAQIITFGTMAARNAVRDTGRALGYTYGEVDVIAKLIPQPVQGRHIPLAVSTGLVKGKGAEQRPDPILAKEYLDNPRAKHLIDLATQLEGTIRSNGVHAAGVVIAPERIVKYIPLQRAQKGGISTQYDMHWVEELGLLKMDFLGLSNLTIIQNAMRIVKRVYGTTIDLATLPLDDAKTYELLSRGDTTGVFQLESAGMKRYIRELKPNRLDDIIAMVALYRPGPMQFIDDFIDRKHGRKKVVYDHPGMEAALGNTYGILVYQEQFMQISKDMCGFTGGQADTLRKAIGKKQRETMLKMKVEFIDGMVTHSQVERSFAEKFWDQLEAFADYCFNKSHSACYALIAYQTAYLKAHYPAAFMAALMTSNYDNIDKIAIGVAESRHLGIEVLAPDVNESFLEFAAIKETNTIRFGLAAVKNVGRGAIEAIVAAREKDGPFKSVEDFAKRVNASEVNKKVWDSLIKCGAFDTLGERGQLLHNIDTITGYAAKAQKNALSGQIDIFGSLGQEENLPGLHLDVPPTKVETRERLAWEKELLGLYLSEHPLDAYSNFLNDFTKPLANLTVGMDGQTATIGGIITTVRRISTKKNDMMAFVGLEDKSGSVELIVFPKAYEATPELWEPDKVVVVKGKISTKDRDGRVGTEIKLMVDSAKQVDYDTASVHVATRPKQVIRAAVEPDAIVARPSSVVTVKLQQPAEVGMLVEIKALLETAPGSCEVYLLLVGQSEQKIRLPFRVDANEDLLGKLRNLAGSDRVNLEPSHVIS
jgi:DNA polymerase-3 subunit alpha